MTGQRLRLNDYERAYLLRLVHADIDNLHFELLGKPMMKLIAKLEADDAVSGLVPRKPRGQK